MYLAIKSLNHFGSSVFHTSLHSACASRCRACSSSSRSLLGRCCAWSSSMPMALMASGDQPTWQVGSCCASVLLDVGLHSFPLVHPGQQGEKFRKLLGSISWSSQVLSSRGRAALRELIFGFVVVYSLYTVVAWFCFVTEVLVLRLWQCYMGRYWRTSRACRWGSSMGGLWAGICMRMRRSRRAPEASAAVACAPARARPLASWKVKKGAHSDEAGRPTNVVRYH